MIEVSSEQIYDDLIDYGLFVPPATGCYVLTRNKAERFKPYRFCHHRYDAEAAYNQAAGLYDARVLVRYSGGRGCEVLRTSEL